MDARALRERLLAAERPRGPLSRTLRLGDLRLRIEGLDADLAGGLDRRWGGFLTAAAPPVADLRLLVRDAGPEPFSPGTGLYRLAVAGPDAERIVVSDHFALGEEPAAFRLAITAQEREPDERILENVCRVLAARMAVAHGGFAMHAAGVLREGRAYLFAGKSRSGKTTAVGLARPAQSLGDDFALVVHSGTAWQAPALPFDNAERIEHEPPPGWFPVAGIWRLYPSERNRVERLAGASAVASLMACTAFPWILPDLAAALLDHVQRFVTEGAFAHLHFRRDVDLWASDLLREGGGTS